MIVSQVRGLDVILILHEYYKIIPITVNYPCHQLSCPQLREEGRIVIIHTMPFQAMGFIVLRIQRGMSAQSVDPAG